MGLPVGFEPDVARHRDALTIALTVRRSMPNSAAGSYTV